IIFTIATRLCTGDPIPMREERRPNAAVSEDPKHVNSWRLKNQKLSSPQLNPTLTC
ncbi:unnamed protein product, partial [Bubo scandiacus]